MKKYNIMCQVSGGITGTRTSYLKNDDGTIFKSTNYDSAAEYAEDLEKIMNSKSKKTQFRYWVEEV